MKSTLVVMFGLGRSTFSYLSFLYWISKNKNIRTFDVKEEEVGKIFCIVYV